MTQVAGYRNDPLADASARVGYAGDVYGLRSGLRIDPTLGKEIAFFATMVPVNRRGEPSGFSTDEKAIARRFRTAR